MTTTDLIALSDDIARWAAAAAFRSSDDIPRIRRSPGWLPDFTPASIDERRVELAHFRERLAGVAVPEGDVAAAVDARLLGSVLDRVEWDLDVLRNWERDAVFLVGQILGPWFDLLLPRPPFSAAVEQGLIAVARSIPERVELARDNLARAGVGDLARVAALELAGIDARFAASVDALDAVVSPEALAQLRALAPAAGASLAGLAAWLKDSAADLAVSEPVGRDRFVWFLRHVALIADEPEELVRAALQDYRRAVVAEVVTRNRYRDVPPAPLAESIQVQVARQEAQEAEVRAFSEAQGLLSQPDSLGRYHVAPMPAYLQPLRFLGVSDDLTDEDRLDVDGVSYMPDPQPDLPYFYAANAQDPRLGIIHEGAHYKQLALSWANPDPIRRRYVDSVANEGIAFYNEEFMLLAGLFDDAPHSQEIVHNFNRLRSLRVVVDINLATGAFTLDEAIDFFVRLVPMDVETAREECAMYLATPGLAMSYHVGKQQLLRLVTDAVVAQGGTFSLRDVHDRVWANGNVPFSLQRWEILGDRGDLDAIDAYDGTLTGA
ncbi:DUF885 family protein [Microbacterium rhizomatis]|uniref:DUF885 domain-containing protein n=1 Tax=Microbacterium rhizomatis TaxID=1631477 RepID=A0A5J5J143_9MICO|nr:DUF885 family protein [Microbacterium rhizomatis]KAA9106569.1 DUF885 domain-containing protein [Microbacterium rhizomatis]